MYTCILYMDAMDQYLSYTVTDRNIHIRKPDTCKMMLCRCKLFRKRVLHAGVHALSNRKIMMIVNECVLLVNTMIYGEKRRFAQQFLARPKLPVFQDERNN